MDRREVIYRVRQSIQSRLEQAGIGLSRPCEPRGATGRAWCSEFPAGLDAGPYCRAADRILAGRFDVFELNDAQIGFPPPWNRDPKSGVTAPQTFGKLLNYRDPSIVGEIKYLWEPNRHLELVTLAQAWRLSQEPRFAEGCRELLSSWIEQNPYMMGPNWSSSLELAIRLINWSVAWHLLGGAESGLFEGSRGAAFRSSWTGAIRQHCSFISRHLSRHSSANNHLIGELAGLFVASVTWPLWPESAGWRDQAQRELETESDAQTYADGVNKEQAVWYHHEVMDLLLIAGLFGDRNDAKFSSRYWRCLESMAEFLAGIMDAGGHVPAIGDSDDAVIVRFHPDHDFDVYASLLATAAVLFNRADFRDKAAHRDDVHLDDKTRWLLGSDAEARFNSIQRSSSGAGPRREFPESGYYVLGENLETPREIRIVADTGALGYLSIAAHGHADALSFTLSAAGQPLLIDAGTFSYASANPWRQYFRGTAAHNTVRVDGLDQSVSGGSFLWVKHANARTNRADIGGDLQVLSASHDGYRRLKDPVSVTREWRFQKGSGQLTIDDSLEAQSAHSFEIFWHFAAACRVERTDAQIIAISPAATLQLTWPAGCEAHIVSGSESPPLGWVSGHLGRKAAVSTVVISGTFSGRWRGETLLEISLKDS